MVAIETYRLDQTAIYWPAGGHDAYGELLFGDPIEIPIRLEEGTREVIDPETGNISSFDIAAVDRDVPVLSLIWLGKIADVSMSDPIDDLRQVVQFRKSPSFKNLRFRREIEMMRYKEVDVSTLLTLFYQDWEGNAYTDYLGENYIHL